MTTAKDLGIRTGADLNTLKEHIERYRVITNKMLDKREEAMKSSDKVMLQVHWAENGILITPNEAQSAFYGGRGNWSLHTGYQYSKEIC